MLERILDIAEAGAFIKVQREQLLIERQDAEAQRMPLEEVAALVVSHPAVTYTQAVLAGLMRHGGVFIACDGRRLPAGMMLPLVGHHLQQERIRIQLEAGKPVRKRAWQQIVRAKIRAQARLLHARTGEDCGLSAMAQRVRSGDPENLEAQAARRYWPALFSGVQFRRDPDGEGVNVWLNYGYAVLRGLVARAVVATGLHPSLGLQHHNRYDPYCLADDLMEPYRPLIDGAVVALGAPGGREVELTPAVKQALMAPLFTRQVVLGQERSLFEVLGLSAYSLQRMFQGEGKQIILPEW